MSKKSQTEKTVDYERFETLARKLVAVPKDELKKREAEERAKKDQKRLAKS